MNPQNIIKTTPQDFFLHMGALVTLYVSVAALLNLTFSIINYFAPDQLAGYFYAGSIAWPISMLVILVPILYICEWFIIKDIRTTPEKKDLWMRRWRIYLTLFLAGATIAVDLIALINVYLSGEIAARFVWKVLAVLLVSGTVFKYYFFSINEKSKWAPFIRKFNVWTGIVLVLAAIITGFIVVGSPTKQRNLRFDNQRVSDLQNIQWQVVNYWQQKEKLPATLADMNNAISGNVIPKDPENKSVYGYTIKSDKSFELCADFALKMEDGSGKGAYGYGRGGYDTAVSSYPAYPEGMNDNWKHEAGKTCFTRTIDPEIYPPNKTVPARGI